MFPEIKKKFYTLENLQGDRLTESLDPRLLNSQWKLDDSSEAIMRNRYSNIAAWESNRIHLKLPAQYSDYINASPIELESLRDGTVKRWIATQVNMSLAPRDGAVTDILDSCRDRRKLITAISGGWFGKRLGRSR